MRAEIDLITGREVKKYAGEPSLTDVHVDAPLTNLAIQYKNLAFVGERVLPIVPVKKESDKYFLFGKEELYIEKTVRAPGAEAHEIRWTVTTPTYSADEHSLRYLLPDRIVNNADAPVRPRINSTNKLMRKILLRIERNVAGLVQTVANVGTSAQPSPTWLASSPDIEGDIDTAKSWMRQNAGTDPTSILLPYQVAQYVKRDSTIRNLIRYTVPGDILLRSGDLPPVIFNLEVIIAGAVYNTAAEGATEVIGDVWNDNVLVFYKEPTPSLDALSLGYQFRVDNPVTITYRVDTRKGEMIEVSVIQDEKIVAANCGYIIASPLG